ncbi:MAG: thioesterase family protein [Deltaproteobacteria bacterium]|nr:thioesterase family protein [Deltaproteobacteria bacterium]
MEKSVTSREDGMRHEVKLTVPFHDLDPMNMVWHGNYLKYFDVARLGLFDQCGIDLFDYYNQTNYLFPIIKTTTKHVISLRHRDEFICRATVIEARSKIVMGFEIRRVGRPEICAKGRSEQVAVKYPEIEMSFEIPDDIRKALGF